MYGVAVVLLVIISIALITLVVMQSGKSEGLSGAISGGAEQLFGKKKARGIDAVLNRATIIVSVIFFLLTFLIAYVFLCLIDMNLPSGTNQWEVFSFFKKLTIHNNRKMKLASLPRIVNKNGADRD